MKKLTLKDCLKMAKDRGGQCLSKKYTNNHSKMLWMCKLGHTWMSCFNSIKNFKTWCPECCGHKKISLKECIEFAKQKNGKCLSKRYTNNHSKMLWGCRLGHTWRADFTHIKSSKTWCPYCANNVRKNINTARQTAMKRGGKCLSKTYVNNSTKLKWKCSIGHKWEARFADVRNGKWCPYCARNVKKNILDCSNIAKERGGKCLSNVYINSSTPIKWECENKHIWMASYSNISHGTWCPECSDGKSQRNVATIVRKILKTEVLSDFRGFDWLRTDEGYKQEIDIWVPKFKLAIEYDGEQHFMPVKFGSMSEKRAKSLFERIKKNDQNKNLKIGRNKKDIKFFIRIKYNDTINEDTIRQLLIKNGVCYE